MTVHILNIICALACMQPEANAQDQAVFAKLPYFADTFVADYGTETIPGYTQRTRTLTEPDRVLVRKDFRFTSTYEIIDTVKHTIQIWAPGQDKVWEYHPGDAPKSNTAKTDYDRAGKPVEEVRGYKCFVIDLTSPNGFRTKTWF